jgi:hypothetical protein
MKVNELDFTDDRLTLLLRRLSQPEIWQAIETDLGRSFLRVYELRSRLYRWWTTRKRAVWPFFDDTARNPAEILPESQAGCPIFVYLPHFSILNHGKG